MLQALALEANHDRDQVLQTQSSGQHPMEELGSQSSHGGQDGPGAEVMMFYEITVASVDQPKLLSRLSEALVSIDRFYTCSGLQVYFIMGTFQSLHVSSVK